MNVKLYGKRILPPGLKRRLKRGLRNLHDSLAFRRCRKPLPLPPLRHIVFVCTGNICRSPFAEHYLKHVWGEQITIESCGLDACGGASPPLEAVQAAGEFGLDLAAHRSKQLFACDLLNADLIVAMEYCHYLRLAKLLPGVDGKIRLLREFAPWPDRLFSDIHDPFGLGVEECSRCFRQMRVALDRLKALFSTCGGKSSLDLLSILQGHH